ncbi:uncharacterized protein [Apostichopus japonicus]|uniref:uncharacterized protein isoform X2 n=1 Tax=Stichopus japonicus TaxID=307972 RepID=UPI003AB40DEC
MMSRRDTSMLKREPIRMDVAQKLAFCGVFAVIFLGAKSQEGFFPPFYTISHYPEGGRCSTGHIYAIDRFGFADELKVTKEDKDLSSVAVETGQIVADGVNFGVYFRLRAQERYGAYKGTYTIDDFTFITHTFLKPKSDILNTRGVYTVHIYPESLTSDYLKEEIQIGVGWSPGCSKIIWWKGKKRNINTGPKLTLKSVQDAGLYTIGRPKRVKRGWFVQILVTASNCPENYWYNTVTEACEKSAVICQNGGVLHSIVDFCNCPPYFVGFLCQCAAFSDHMFEQFFLGFTGGAVLTCGDLPGGNPKCKGYLICGGDSYGCRCAPGWWGNACDRACPKGKWGANCLQNCPSSETDCNRFYGPSTNLISNGCIYMS